VFGDGVGASTRAEQCATAADTTVYDSSGTRRGSGEEVSDKCVVAVVAGVTQVEGEEGGFDDENKGSLGCEAIRETTSVMEGMGLVWSREDDGATKTSTHRGTIRETETFFASFGGRVDDLPKSRDGSSPRFERLSMLDSLKCLRSEIIILDNDVRKYSRMLWLKDEQGEARRRWKVGKEMSFTLLSEEKVVLNRLSSLENRDYRNLEMEINVFYDESN